VKIDNVLFVGDTGPGWSGGPVFNTNLEVVAVIVWTWRPERGCGQFYRANFGLREIALQNQCFTGETIRTALGALFASLLHCFALANRFANSGSHSNSSV